MKTTTTSDSGGGQTSPVGVRARLACCLMAGCATLFSPGIQSAENTAMTVASLDGDLTDLSLEALMNIEVQSVSKRAESLQGSAAAVYVLEGDSIRRSGVKTLAEVFRLVPGLMVARLDSNTWAVSARGFNSTTADKLEVLLDGRSLYTPLFSGVFWEAQGTFIDDIERIEVIRGPGAALWGANAVNGVINIVTKDTKDTHGNVLQVGGGGEYEGYGNVRHGGELGESGHYRIYAQQTQYNAQEAAGAGDADDRWRKSQVGFRTDFELDERSSLSVQGDTYDAEINRPGGGTEETRSGFNLLTRWVYRHSRDTESSVKLYYDHSEYDNETTFDETRDTYDLDLRHRFVLGTRQQFVVGGGFRETSDEIGNLDPGSLYFLPDRRTDQSYNVFAQDQIAVVPERVHLTLGVKLENNDYTGEEVQPSMRLAYIHDERNTVWTAVSRAVRLPTRLDHNIFAPTVSGNSNFVSEELLAYEAGYRSLLTDTLSLDVALFYNEYDQLRGISLNSLPPLLDNTGEGETQGVELTLRWRPVPQLSIVAAYSYFDMDIHAKAGSNDILIETYDESDPQNQALFIADWDINDRLRLHTRLQWVDELPDEMSGGQIVDEYLSTNLSLIWKAGRAVELSVTGSNLQDASHPEHGSEAEIQRSVHGEVTWYF